MASRRLVPASLREALLGIPSDIASLERNYLLADDDLDLIGTRRRPENRLGLALHIALLRHPGQGWHDNTEPPAPLVAWLAEQIEVPFPSLARYGSRGAAVLALALFEEQLREAIESRDVAFKGSGLKFRVNVEIAYALGLYDQETRDGLHTVRKIRNKFAHSRDPLEFEHEEVAALCRQLRTDYKTANLRERYLIYLRAVEFNLRRSELLGSAHGA